MKPECELRARFKDPACLSLDIKRQQAYQTATRLVPLNLDLLRSLSPMSTNQRQWKKYILKRGSLETSFGTHDHVPITLESVTTSIADPGN